MEWFEAIILGLIQGLTEFLPVSSSGHLIIGKELLGIELNEDLTFELVVHAATVLSTIVIFREQIWSLLRGFFKLKNNDETDYLLKIGVSMIPVFVVGVFFKDYVESLFGSILGVGIALLVTAVLLICSDLLTKKKSAENNIQKSASVNTQENVAKYRNDISYWQAFVVGLAQAFAVVPGLSRSGSTIATGLICGIKREVIAQFSFLMVMIPILGEAFLQIVGGEIGASSIGALPLILGFISAFLSGLLACKAMIALVKRAKLYWFAVYCAVVAILIFIF